jgi:hypothetical protein
MRLVKPDAWYDDETYKVVLVTAWIAENLDYLLFSAAALTALAMVLARFRRSLAGELSWVGLLAGGAMLGVLALGWFRVDAAGGEIKSLLRSSVEGFAPTYAVELQMLGHEHLGFDTPPDHPLYLQLIEAQKRWLAVNPAVADVYTVRRNAQGRWAFLVDSETDYNRDGRFDDDREARTPIGEAYDEESQEWDAAAAGRSAFNDQPTTDRWGTWVSAAVPIRNARGEIDAVLGVDYPAEEWSGAIDSARLASTAMVGIAALLLIGATMIICLLKQNLIQRKADQQAVTAARDAAEAANSAKSAFLANMSHEIRTPIAAVLGYADLLLDLKRDDPELTEYATIIRRSGSHLLTLVDDILDLSRIEAGKLQVEPTPTNPMQIAEEAASTLRVRAIEKGLALRVRCGQPDRMPLTVLTDATRLRQILVNLVGNAVKFTERGNVTIDVAYEAPAHTGEAGTIRFAVSDTGPGISQSTLDRLFQPFAQGDESATRRHGGSGLGLSISARLARALGGEITVQSTPGRGSTFTLSIAAPIAESPAAPAPSVPVVGERPLNGARILLAEDCDDNQRLIGFVLCSAGATVETVNNGRAVVERLLGASGKPIDIVLMDMQMPVLDGYSAVRELRHAGYSGRIVALTAHAMVGDREKCLAAGCDRYAVKPIDRAQLIGTLAGLLTGGAPASTAA